MFRTVIVCFFLSLSLGLSGQSYADEIPITGLSISQDDDYAEWNFYGAEENPIGYLKLRWKHQNDWTEWDYRIGDITGHIKQRTKGDANVWELRSNNTVLTIKTIYSGDFNQWRITDDSKTLTFKTLYQNVYDGWKSSSKAGDFEVYSQWEMDPRDWIIYNKLNPEYNQPFVVAMVFIASFYSSPKY